MVHIYCHQRTGISLSILEVSRQLAVVPHLEGIGGARMDGGGQHALRVVPHHHHLHHHEIHHQHHHQANVKTSLMVGIVSFAVKKKAANNSKQLLKFW